MKDIARFKELSLKSEMSWYRILRWVYVVACSREETVKNMDTWCGDYTPHFLIGDKIFTLHAYSLRGMNYMLVHKNEVSGKYEYVRSNAGSHNEQGQVAFSARTLVKMLHSGNFLVR